MCKHHLAALAPNMLCMLLVNSMVVVLLHGWDEWMSHVSYMCTNPHTLYQCVCVCGGGGGGVGSHLGEIVDTPRQGEE